jgi:hypothetical protein
MPVRENEALSNGHGDRIAEPKLKRTFSGTQLFAFSLSYMAVWQGMVGLVSPHSSLFIDVCFSLSFSAFFLLSLHIPTIRDLQLTF